MGVSCLSCVVKPCTMANEDDPRRHCPKASKCGSRTKGPKGVGEVPNSRNIKRRIQRLRTRLSLCYQRYPCQSSGSLPYVAATTLCGLSQAHQHVCQAHRTTPRKVRCVLDCA